MLRDILVNLEGFGTWPCDEINYIWRHGNITFSTDELARQHVHSLTKQFIRTKFQQLVNRHKLQYVVEKTCANSLRVGFVDEIIPEARYLFIVRDGRDVVASALKRWQASLDLKYIAAKARYVPLSDIPYYGLRYIGNRLYRFISEEKRLAFWGPRFEGMDELLRHESLPVVCAHQWRRCVERAEEDFQEIGPSRVHFIQYEHLVNDTDTTLNDLFNFLEIEVDKTTIAELTKNVHASSVGNWRKDLTTEMIEQIQPVIQDTQARYGYI